MKVSKKLESERDAALKKVVSRKRALDSTEKTVLDKAVKNVKQILERKEASKKILKKIDAKPKVVEQSLKSVKDEKPKIHKSDRGIIYLGHIPHGFYEEEMKDYFSQFGKVTRTRISRSKKTGNSRGYGFVEFANDDVARVAAQTMNNYLMCGRLLKATYITPEKKHPRFFTKHNWSKDKYPTLMNRKKTVSIMNAKISDKQHAKHVKKTVKRLRALESTLSKHGLSLKFKPIDTQES